VNTLVRPVSLISMTFLLMECNIPYYHRRG